MQLVEAVKILREHEADLKQMGLQSLYIFGSTARGDQRTDSDVDLFFDFEKGTLGIFDLMRIEEKTSDILGCKADIMTRNSIHPYIKADVEKAALQVF